MSKFNLKREEKNRPDTKNLAGGEAFTETPALEFATLLLTSFVSDKYYEKAADSTKRAIELLKILPLEFAMKAAVYTRRVAGLRSISHVIAGELAERLKGSPDAREFFAAVVERPDDISEILSYRLQSRGQTKLNKVLTHGLRKGLGLAFQKFDAYQFGKYRGEGNAVKLVDVVNILHPKNKTTAEINRENYLKILREHLSELEKHGGNQIKKDALFARIEEIKQSGAETARIPSLEALTLGLLRSETYQSDLVKAGQAARAAQSGGASKEEAAELQGELTKTAWREFLSDEKTPYFALLRNLRNIAQKAPELVSLACSKLTDKRRIYNSLVLPFRFFTAYEEISQMRTSEAREILVSLDAALQTSFDNLPGFEGPTLVALDISGSMGGRTMKIAGLFAAAVCKKNNADLIRFDDSAAYYQYNPADSITTIAERISASRGGTDVSSVLRKANKAYSRIIYFSDMQGWKGGSPQTALREYERRFKCQPYIYSWDLAGHGTLQFPEERIAAFGGYHTDLLELIGRENSPAKLVEIINALKLSDYVGKRPEQKAKGKREKAAA